MARVQGQVRYEAQERGEGRIEMSPAQRAEYGRAMRDLRASYGLTDGLRVSQSGFHEYLARRRAEDAKARGWG